MKVYDCFCYFNEDMLLEIRLATLWEYVDFFIISEASYSHTGQSRTLEFDINKFSKYRSKIRYLTLNERPEGSNDFWRNENFIRNNVVNGLYDAEHEDLILISDLDEIPNPAGIGKYDPKFLRGDFDQKYYSYYLNNLWIGDVDRSGNIIGNSNVWRGTKITSFRHFVNFFKMNATSVRSYKSSGYLRALKRQWFARFNVQLIHNGGWHFTWIFSVENIIKKIEHTAHQEFNTENRKDPDYIRKVIEQGRDLNKPFARYKAQKLDESYPSYILENAERYKEFILPV